jgi:hypothetical protein
MPSPGSRIAADFGEGARRWPLDEARTVADPGGRYPPTDADLGRSRTLVYEFLRQNPFGEIMRRLLLGQLSISI